MKGVLATHGVPDSLRADKGTQFMSSEYVKFAKQYGFDIATSSLHFPQSNGLAERAVQTAKKNLQQEDPDVAFQNYRNSKHSAIGMSPAMALMKCPLKGRAPVHARVLNPSVEEREKLAATDKAAKDRYKYYYDQHYGAKHLPQLQPGQPVQLKTDNQKGWSQPGMIIESD
ncbi:uncharacterized protein K02A2.6-like [Macrobrachium nipponense]|uniref:uncharacterized protein K02A2.6-like n=1 Tax=Macrobrachium nipponense TaxID=159736 RepID=UPI0030C8C0A7